MRFADFRRLLFIGGFVYIAYRMLYSQDAISTQQPTSVDYPQSVIPEQESSDRSIILMPFYLAAGAISWFFQILWWMVTTAWAALAFIMRFLRVIWAIVMLIINGVYIAVTYTLFKRVTARDNTKFFAALAGFIIGPLIINSLFSYKQFALNLFLPIYLTIFVDVLATNHPITGRTIRNFVFFVLICAFL